MVLKLDHYHPRRQDIWGHVTRAIISVRRGMLIQHSGGSLLTRNAKGKATTEGDPLPGAQVFIGPLFTMYWNTDRMYR